MRKGQHRAWDRFKAVKAHIVTGIGAYKNIWAFRAAIIQFPFFRWQVGVRPSFLFPSLLPFMFFFRVYTSPTSFAIGGAGSSSARQNAVPRQQRRPKRQRRKRCQLPRRKLRHNRKGKKLKPIGKRRPKSGQFTPTVDNIWELPTVSFNRPSCSHGYFNIDTESI